jgi:hypothetical protein
MRKPIFQSLLLATILAVGFGTLWATVTVWAKEQIRHATRRWVFERLELRADGTPVVSPEIIWRPDDAPPTPTTGETSLDAAFLAADHNENLMGLRYGWEWRLQPFTDPRYPEVIWHFITDGQRHGSAYFIGYERRTDTRIGYLGMAGFRADALPAGERLPFWGNNRGIRVRLHNLQTVPWRLFGPAVLGSPREVVEVPWQVYVQGDDNKVYQVDLGQRTVRVAFEDGPIHSSALLVRTAPASEVGRRDILVRTDDSVVVINGRDGSQRRFVIPEELRAAGFTFGETTAGEGLACWTPGFEPGADVLTYHVAWFDAAGTISRREEVSLNRTHDPDTQSWFLGVSLPVPLLDDLYVTLIHPYHIPLYEPPPSYPAALQRELAEYWPALLIAHLLSLVLAGLCYWRQSRYGANRAERVVWPVFVFLLGLPGWIGFRYGQTWPSVERCPSCEVVVPSDRDRCAACHAEFPLPALTGTEVFA